MIEKKISLYWGFVKSHPALTIFIACFLLDLSLVLMFPNLVPEAPDKLSRYDPIALSLVKGEGFSIHGNPTAVAAPAYPAFLSVIYAVFGYSKTVVRIFLSLLNAGHCVLFYLIAKRYFGGRVPALTALALIFSPYFLYVIFVASTETLFTFLHALFLYCLCIAFQKKTARYFLASGVILGATSLCRAVTLLLPVATLPVFLFLYWGNLKRGSVHLAIFVSSFVLTVSPWAIRNYFVFDQFVPVQTLGGVHLFMATPAQAPGEDWLNIREQVREMSPVQRDKFYYEEGWERIKHNPGKFLQSMGSRMWRMWYATDSGRDETILMYKNLGFLILAFMGLVINRRRWKEFLPFLVIIAYYVGLHMFLIALLRYILPIIPIITVLAMISVNALFNKVKILAKLWPAPHGSLIETKA